jgi:hypothetical protein
MFSQQVPPFTQQINKESSSLGLSQDTIAILQQFDSQGTITEQQTYRLRYPLQDNVSLYFADADIANRAQNEELFNKIKKYSSLV